MATPFKFLPDSVTLRGLLRLGLLLGRPWPLKGLRLLSRGLTLGRLLLKGLPLGRLLLRGLELLGLTLRRLLLERLLLGGL